jgi:hypothetical protein
LKFPDKCLYHLSKSHATEDCHVKKECDRLCASKNTTGLASFPTGQLRHLTKDTFEDVIAVDDGVDSADFPPNDTNEADLLYFACVTNHYLCLVRKIPDQTVDTHCHPTNFPIIADSGANFHMFREKEFFESITPATGHAILGDGKTSIKILGVGTVKCCIGDNIHSVHYVPELSESIYSLFQHIQSPGHGLKSSFEDGLFIVFPTFQTRAIICQSDIYLYAIPVDSMVPIPHSTCSDSSTIYSYCHHLIDFQQEVTTETEYWDNILSKLQEFYATIKTKHQLNLDVPADFRKLNQHQLDYNLQLPLKHQDTIDQTSSVFASSTTDAPTLLPDTNKQILLEPDANANTSSFIISLPITRSVDKPSSSLPHTLTMSEDFLHASVGFHRVDTIKQHFHHLNCNMVKLDLLLADAVLDPGALATLRKSFKKFTPVPRSKYFVVVMRHSKTNGGLLCQIT